MRKIMTGLAVFLLFGISSSMAFSYLSGKEDTVHLISATDTRISIEEGTLTEPILSEHEIQKEIRVRNQSQSPCYVRVACFYNNGEMEKMSIREGWIQKADGYYYRTEELSPGEATDPLIQILMIPDEIPEEEIESGKLFFYAEAVEVCGSCERSWERMK